jgi:hypothetical protein
VQNLAVRVDGHDHARCDVRSIEHRPVHLEDRLPDEAWQLTEQPAVEAEEDAQALGDGEDEVAPAARTGRQDKVGTAAQTSRAMCSATARARFWWQLGHRQRPRQEKATKSSEPQWGQRTRAKPSCRSPQASPCRQAPPGAAAQEQQATRSQSPPPSGRGPGVVRSHPIRGTGPSCPAARGNR